MHFPRDTPSLLLYRTFVLVVFTASWNCISAIFGFGVSTMACNNIAGKVDYGSCSKCSYGAVEGAAIEHLFASREARNVSISSGVGALARSQRVF